MFIYWGRRGALSDFMFEFAREIDSNFPATISISFSNELFDEFRRLGESLFPVVTFDSSFRAATSWGKLLRLRRACWERFRRDRTRVVVNMMPHVWFPFIAPVLRKTGIRHIVVVHDASPHPGDPTGFLNRWLLREVRLCDHAVTLSKFVQNQLVSMSAISREKTTSLFHPDLTFRSAPTRRPRNGPLRVLFFGRLLSYKGIDLFLDALALLGERGVVVEAGVLGSGNVEMYAPRFAQLGVHVENRWFRSDELSYKFQQYDVVAICHAEASQSGAVAAAFGAGMPVVAVPVGGIPEQVSNQVTGLIVSSRSANEFADALQRLADSPDLLGRLTAGVQRSKPTRSMARFAGQLLQIVEEQIREAGTSAAVQKSASFLPRTRHADF